MRLFFNILTLVLIGVVIYFSAISNNKQNDLVKQGAESHEALCIFKSDLERRIGDGEQFLRDNPNGIPGIPEETLRNSIDNQKRTLASLAVLDCT